MIINICDIIYLEVMKMLKTKEVILKVSPRSKRYYQEKGYDISKGTILVKIEDLQPTSKEKVCVVCDYCNTETYKEYRHFLQQREVVPKDACRKCTYKKEQDIWGDKPTRDRRSTNKGRVTYTYDVIQQALRDEDYELLTPPSDYETQESYIQYKCHNPEHPVVTVTAKAFMRGQRCRQCYFDSQKGSGSPRWKGGKRETKLFFRRSLGDWMRSSFEAYNYTCPITGIEGYSEVHHIRPFVDILDEAFAKHGVEYKQNIGEYDVTTIELLAKEVQEIHNRHLGVPLYKPVHTLFHSLYGVVATEESYYDFLHRCKHGDLKGKIEEIVYNHNTK